MLQLVLQGGSLVLLAYLIWWMTQTGAPKLFDRLSGVQSAIESHSHRLKDLEEAVEALRQQIQDHQHESPPPTV